MKEVCQIRSHLLISCLEKHIIERSSLFAWISQIPLMED